MPLIMTIGWIAVAVLTYTYGFREGLSKGTLFTLQELTKQQIIAVDTNTGEICPGNSRKTVEEIEDFMVKNRKVR